LLSKIQKAFLSLLGGVLISLLSGVILLWLEPDLRSYLFPPQRLLNYSLTVQKMREGSPYQEPFESAGQEIFENGWKFRLNISSPQAGYLYLLNEGPTANGVVSLNLLFPSPSTNDGSAHLIANQIIQPGWYVFDEHQGTEKFWIVWSSKAVAELEAVKGAVNPQDKGTIRNINQASVVQEFLRKNSSQALAVDKDRAKKQTYIKGKGDVLVSLIELEHH
jgi:hypothetical protein